VKLAKFIVDADLANKTEVTKACLLAFYHLKKEGVEEFTSADYARWIEGHNFSQPNVTRLTKKLKKSTDTIKGSKSGTFRLEHTFLKQLEASFPQLSEKSQDVEDDGTILPPVLYENTRRGYVESLAKQINGSYEHNIFDGCAVLMRRLEEVLLIMSYENLGIAAAIKDGSGQYVMLERIVADAAGNGTLNLSRNSRKSIETFRELGNYSAHKITYICRREFIKEKVDDYRALIDELLHKAGLRT